MRLVPKGLVTDPSRLVAGDGGLIQAENVVFRSEGLVETRAALEMVDNETAFDADATTMIHSREWDSKTVSFGAGFNVLNYIVRDNETDPLLIQGVNLAIEKTRIYSELAEGRCVWTLPAGMRCLDQPDQAAGDGTQPGVGAFMRMPGAPRIVISSARISSSLTGFLATTDTVAYRATLVRWIITSNGARIPIEGAPSDRVVVENTLGGAVDVSLRILVSGDIRQGDEVRVYRTPTNGVAGADPGDEMIQRFTWSKDDDTAPSAYIVDFVDQAPSTEFSGPSLYTNSSQQGATRANYRLRLSRDLATYQGKLFYGGGNACPRQSNIIKHVGEVSGTDKSETLLSVRTDVATADWALGATTITGVPPDVFRYLAVGQLITGSTAGAPVTSDGLYGSVVSWDALAFTIEIDTPTTVLGTNAHFIVWDWLAWDNGNESYRVYAPYVIIGTTTLIAPRSTSSALSANGYGVLPIQTGGASLINGAVEMAFDNLYHDEEVAPDSIRPRMYSQTGADANLGITVTIEYDGSFGSDPSADAMSFFGLPSLAITSTKAGAFSFPVYLTYDESTSVLGTGNSPATLWWSKINQPESVPLGNFAIVGDASQPISRIFATIDRLWILKTDGLYCAYGSGDTEDSITIQLVDGTFRMIDTINDYGLLDDVAQCSTWAAKCRDTVFAWTRNGIMAIGSGGVQRIDGPIETDIRAITPSYNTTQTETSLGIPFCAASERESIVVFGLRGVSGGEEFVPGYCYVYFVETGMWATWSAPLGYGDDLAAIPYKCAGYGASVGGLLRLPCRAGYMRYLDVPRNNVVQTDTNEYPVTGDRNITFPNEPQYEIDTISGNVVTWVTTAPPSGSRIRDSWGTQFLVISSSEDFGTWTSVLSAEGASPGVLFRVHYPADRIITYSANQPPFTEKHFLSCWAHFQLIRAGTQFTADWRARGHVAGEAPTLTVVYDSPTGDGWPDTRLENDLEYDKAISIPTEVGRSRGVELTITQAQADVFFAMDGLTMQYEAETVRIEGRR